MKDDFVSSGRAVSDMKAHLVLTTKYRKKAFTGVMLNRLHEVLSDLCKKWDCKLIEFNGESDHIYLLGSLGFMGSKFSEARRQQSSGSAYAQSY